MVHVYKIAVPNAAMRMQLGRHPANSHGKLRAAIVGHGRLCSMRGERFELGPTQISVVRFLLLQPEAFRTKIQAAAGAPFKMKDTFTTNNY